MRRRATAAVLLVGSIVLPATGCTAARSADAPQTLAGDRPAMSAGAGDGAMAGSDQSAPPVTDTASAGPPAVAHHSARLEDLAPRVERRPSRLRIEALGIDAPVVALGVAADGVMEVPADASTVAWYEHGPSPGRPGSAVLAAHVDYNGRRGVFFRLADLRAGATVTVDFGDGRSRDFTVVDGAAVAKTALPVDRLFRRGGEPVLTLITCGGSFDPATRSYRDNIVVRAVPTGTPR